MSSSTKKNTRSTTVVAVRKGDQVAMAGDGQVTMGESVMKGNARKVRTMYDGRILVGFAGATADAFTLFERFEGKVKEYGGDITRAAVELAKDWRTDRMLRRLEALLLVADRQKTFLISGMGFLLYTAITGIVYIFYEMTPGYTSEDFKWLMRMHSFAALYGWNFWGLAIICRFDNFPLKLHSNKLILFHWITVIFLAPLGFYYKFFACSATISFIIILYFVMFSQGQKDKTLADLA